VKFYFDVREAVRSEENVAEADARAQTRMKTMVDAFVALIQT